MNIELKNKFLYFQKYKLRCSIGKRGISINKKEGDKKTPKGKFKLKNPKLYKKVRRYYETEGVVFSGDPLDDYEMLMEYVYQDLESVEVA